MSRLGRTRLRIRRFTASRTTHRVVGLLIGEVLVVGALAVLASGAVAGLVAGVQLVAWALLSDDGKRIR
jgi:hypothetical protein